MFNYPKSKCQQMSVIYFSAPLELVYYNCKLPIRWLTRHHKDEIIERYGQVAWDRIDKVLLVKGYIFESVYNAFNNLSRKDDYYFKNRFDPQFQSYSL